ncbi:talin-2-like isoform X2 [Electrophorus electricus]|uniref:talin-2-like isoform X2 n=1 Tax=Electrophorus electricus TaxID=8005 RepID=UPI0015CFD812|nr:talin-2-like isoform X2 [Electrophorus electricus]
MVALSLKICVRQCNVVKTLQFEPSTAVYDACRVIRERVPEAQSGQASEYGLFLSDEDPRKGIWLDGGRTLDYYMLRNGDILEYKTKHRPQKIKMLDGAVKTVMVDDSKTVGELLITICSRIGITNYDEYSLIQELVEEKKDEGLGTLKKEHPLLGDERKMEKLRAKLHTEDDLNWLDHGRTFREQGIVASETLLLRRKFFYSDLNVDSRDPVQLNLLYVQARDDILNGSHPVSFDKASVFGGIQTHIQFGPHIEHKHKAGFLDLKEFLPKEYMKQRGAEKKIFQEQKACGEMTEIESKVKYVKLARSLRTYGVSFFLVKEKLKSKNKLVPRLLGVTKESVMRVDEKTKEVLQDWPLTRVKRWAASPKSFTLDFGEYQESYYSVQTTEGEQISQLIAGYIDIILKKKQSKDRFGLESDEEAAMLEESISPKKSTVVQQQSNRVGQPEYGLVALPGVLRSSSVAPETLSLGTMPSPQQQITTGQMHLGHMPPLSAAQQALVGTINTSMQAVQKAQLHLEGTEDIASLGDDWASKMWNQNKVDESKHEIHSQVGAITAGTASVVNLTAGDPLDTDYTAVGCAITTISSNLTEMSQGVKLLAGLMEDEVGSGRDLLRAARTLTGAVSDLLIAVEPASGQPRQTVLTAAGHIGQASGDLLRQIEENDTDERFQDVLMSLAKAVANAAAMMVLKAKNVAQVSEDMVLQNTIITAATQCALSTSQLVACAKVVSPTMSLLECQEQLVEAVRLVERSVESCVEACVCANPDNELLHAVSAAASVVSQALAELLAHVRNFTTWRESVGRYDQATDAIMTVTENIFSSMGDAGEMVRQARVLAQATSDLINALRSDAEMEVDVDNSKKLLAAAKLLADATALMVEAAKGAAACPENEDQQQKLWEAAEGLRVATNAAAHNTTTHNTTNATKKKLITRLENASRQAAAAATQTIAAAQNAAGSNKNTAAHQQLVQSCKVLAEHIPHLVQGVRNSQGQPEKGSSQLALIVASQNFLQPGGQMVASAKCSVPTVTDPSAALQLGLCARNLDTSLAELHTAIKQVQEASGVEEMDSVLSVIQTLSNQLSQAKMATVKQQLRPLPGESLEKCAQDLGSTSKVFGSFMAQLLTCTAQGNEHYTGVAVRETVLALKRLAQAVMGVAAATSDPAVASAMLDSGRDFMEGSAELFSKARQVLLSHGDTESQQKLAEVAKAVSHSLSMCVSCLPGQKDVDLALKSIAEATKKLQLDTVPPCCRSFQEAQMDLSQTAADLNQSAGDVVHASRGTSHQLADASGKFSEDFDEFLNAGIEMAGHTQCKDNQLQVIGTLKNISMASSKLLLAAKSLSLDPGAAIAKSLLTGAARSVTDSINHLITLCTLQGPGQKECDNALRELQAVEELLNHPNEPISESSYFDCIENVMENSKVLGESMAGISHNCKVADVEAFGECVALASKALCGLTEAAGQAAYLVGVSDPNSQAGQQGLVDTIQFARANQAIRMACQNLSDPGSSPSQVLSAATIVAKHTSALCNVCRLASSRTDNPVAKRHFVQSAKEVANNTANLVKTIKALDGDFSDENREKCRVAAAPLTDAVGSLTTFASSPEFASVPAQISREGCAAQLPILQSAHSMLASSILLLNTARSLVLNPKDPLTWSTLAGHSRTVSDSIKSLIAAIREKAPGQRECDCAIESISKAIRELEQAFLAAVTQGLPAQDISLQALQEKLMSSVEEVGHLIEPTSTAAKGEAAQLGHNMSQLVSCFDDLCRAAVGVASLLLHHQQQMTVLDQVKTLAESTLQMLYAAKEAGGNPKAILTHQAITEAAQLMREAISDLLLTLNEVASEVGVVGAMVNSITDAVDKLAEGTRTDAQGSFVDYQTTMVQHCTSLAAAAQEMMTKSVSAPEELGSLASRVTADYRQLALQQHTEVGLQVRGHVQELGHLCIALVQKTGALQLCSSGLVTKRELNECVRAITEKVSVLVSALQVGNKDIQACASAASAVSGIVADLDTVIMFASAGTLNMENDAGSFADHRETILKTAKVLVEDTKKLVSGAASGPEKLAHAAQSSAQTITHLSEVVKVGAASLGPADPDTQMVLINAVKDVAKALAELIGATKWAAGKAAGDPSMFHLKSAAKVMITNVTSLLKTVKAVEDVATRGSRALEAAIEAIKQELCVFQSRDTPVRSATPEEFVRMTKGITMATAKAVASGNSARQEDVISTANLSQKVIADMLTACKRAAYHDGVSEELRAKALLYGTECTKVYIDLLEQVLQVLQRPTAEQKQHLAVFSKRVAGAVTELIHIAENMKGSEWVDPEDPTVIAETELLGAAASIEAAAKKLEHLKPRAKPKQADESLDFEEQILEAAKSIATATSALVKSASAAQRELIAQGKVGSIPANAEDDGQWSQGLISAAHLVAAATGSLCEASVQGHHGSEERLISSAKQVSTSTAQLLLTCKVKADHNSEAMRRLQAAGNAVKRASDNLVKAAQKSAFDKTDEDNVVVKTNFVGGIAQIIAAQEEMLKKERELEEARKKLAQIRQQQYKFLPSELRGDED